MSLVVLCISVNLYPIAQAATPKLLINEVESNPGGKDDGNEWIELLNNGSAPVDLSGYSVKNNDGDVYQLSGSVPAQGYLVVTFSKQYLDNNDEIVELYDGSGNLIDRTPAFDDTQDDDGTRSRYPDGSDTWASRPGTPGASNGGTPSPPPGNHRPMADFALSSLSGETGNTVFSADAKNSSDPDGDALTFAWDWGDGYKDKGKQSTHVFSVQGTYVVSLTVSDGRGETDMMTKTVLISDPPKTGGGPKNDGGDATMVCGGLVILGIFLLFCIFMIYRARKRYKQQGQK